MFQIFDGSYNKNYKKDFYKIKYSHSSLVLSDM